MTKILSVVGPEDQGRRMTLEQFDRAQGVAGYLYELSGGVVTVIEVPKRRHLAQMNALKRQIHAYDAAHPGRIDTIATGSECKILLVESKSERHPDLAIYRTSMPGGDDVWSRWIPEIVIEVVSPGSEHRDYVEKRRDYLEFGVPEYWILDFEKGCLLVLRRSGTTWEEVVVRPPEPYETSLLPDLRFDCEGVFDAAAGA